MTTRTTTLPAGEEGDQMKRHLPLGVRIPARIRGGEVDASPTKDGLLERMVGERKLIKQKTATGKVLQVNLCLGGVTEGRMKSGHGGTAVTRASLPKVDGKIANDLQRGPRQADSPVPGISSTNSSRQHSSHRHHNQRLLVHGEAHPHHLQAMDDLPIPTGAAGHSQSPQRMRNPVVGKSHPRSQSVGKWTSMMALRHGETPAVTTTRM